jgi:hypothetical protein
MRKHLVHNSRKTLQYMAYGSFLTYPLLAFVVAISLRVSSIAAETNKEIVEIGFYPVNVFDVDLASRSFKADFYLWLIYSESCNTSYFKISEDGPRYPSIERIEAENGRDLVLERQEYGAAIDQGKRMIWYRVRGTFYHDFNLERYPFDRHNLRIRLENPIWPAEELEYKVTQYRSPPKVDGSLAAVGEWNISRISHAVDVHQYETDWGRKGAKVPVNYSRNSITIQLRRHSALPFWRLLIPIVASVFVATLVFCLRFDKGSSALQLCIAMFLSIVAQHHAFLTGTPSLDYFLRANWFYVLGYAYVIAVMLIALIHGVPIEGQERRKPVCRWVYGLPAIFIVFTAGLWYYIAKV